MGRPADASNDLLERGMRVAAGLPRPIVPEARHMVAMGLFGSLGEFCFVSVTTFLDLLNAAPLLAVVDERLPDLSDISSDPAEQAETLIPGHLAVQVASLVAKGAYESPEALCAAAMASYLVLRDDPDLLAALDSATVHAALERPNVPFSHAVAAFTNRFRRLPPLTASEAVEAMRWSGPAAA